MSSTPFMPSSLRKEKTNMGYVLSRKKLSEIAPNHPFAHEQISFVSNPESSSTSSSEKSSSEASSAAQPDPMAPAAAAYEKQGRELAMAASKRAQAK